MERHSVRMASGDLPKTLCKVSTLIKPQLADDVVKTLGFGCILVTTSVNVVTTLSQRCLSDVVTTIKN